MVGDPRVVGCTGRGMFLLYNLDRSKDNGHGSQHQKIQPIHSAKKRAGNGGFQGYRSRCNADEAAGACSHAHSYPSSDATHRDADSAREATAAGANGLVSDKHAEPLNACHCRGTNAWNPRRRSTHVWSTCQCPANLRIYQRIAAGDACGRSASGSGSGDTNTPPAQESLTTALPAVHESDGLPAWLIAIIVPAVVVADGLGVTGWRFLRKY